MARESLPTPSVPYTAHEVIDELWAYFRQCRREVLDSVAFVRRGECTFEGEEAEERAYSAEFQHRMNVVERCEAQLTAALQAVLADCVAAWQADADDEVQLIGRSLADGTGLAFSPHPRGASERPLTVEEADMKLYYEDDLVHLYHGDCQARLPTLPTHRVLVLTDPPWGSKTRVDNRRFRPKEGEGWHTAPRDRLQDRRPVVGDDQPFDPTPLLRFPRLILWGAQWYAPHLPASGGWFVWYKRKGLDACQWPLSDAELAWTNLGQGVHTFGNRWMGRVRDAEHGEHYHPHQKPIALMRWCIERAGGQKKVALIVDPYAGSGPTLLAAQQLGIPAIGCEIDADYCQVIVDRLRQRVLPLGAGHNGAPRQTQFTDTVPGIASATRGRGRPRKWATRAERNRAYDLNTKEKRQAG